jgi:catechol 2,3-dioxygenase-like lactoylglutathione lyase family enzyme
MQNIQGVHHVAVSVPDIEVARRFYIDLLGAQETFKTEWSEGNAFINEIVGLEECSGRQFMARLGNTFIEVFEYLTPRSPDADARRPVNLFGYTHFGLQVDDIEAVYERMLAAGITFHTPPKHGGGPEADGSGKVGFIATYGRDFFGNVFELIEINRASAIPAL